MVNSCYVVGCKSRFPISLFQLPNGKTAASLTQRRQWIAAMGRDKDWEAGPSARVCEKHFKPTDFNTCTAKRSSIQRRTLKSGAVPYPIRFSSSSCSVPWNRFYFTMTHCIGLLPRF